MEREANKTRKGSEGSKGGDKGKQNEEKQLKKAQTKTPSANKYVSHSPALHVHVNAYTSTHSKVKPS